MHEHAVVIAGGGPTGLMLAGELALAKVDVVIVERRPSQDLAGSRAGGLHSRTIEILDQRGIADRFLAEGQIAQVAGFASVRLDIGDFPTRHPLWARAVAEQDRAHPRDVGRRAEGAHPLRYGGRRIQPGRHGRRRPACRREIVARALRRRFPRRTQCGAQGGGHRLPRLGCDDERIDRAGGDDRGAAVGHPPHTVGHTRPRQGRVRNQRRKDRLQAGWNGRGHADRGGTRWRRSR